MAGGNSPFLRRLIAAVLVCGAVAALVIGVLWVFRASDLQGGPIVQSLQADHFSLVWWARGGQEATVEVRQGTWSHRNVVRPNQGRYLETITGLSPSTLYEYTITTPDGTGATHVVGKGRVRTAPLPGGTFRFLAFGDSGSGDEAQLQLAALMPGYNPDLIVHAGDVIEPKGDLANYPRKFLQPYGSLLANVCIYPCLGNHDWNKVEGRAFFHVFDLPENGPAGVQPQRNYWFDFGDVRFVCFDSNDTLESIQTRIAPWLQATLESAPTRWKIVVFHHAIYTNGNHSAKGALLQNIVPVLDKCKVDVVFSGHNHMYERSKPLRSGRPVDGSDGTVYITTGAGGCELYEPHRPKPAHQAAGDYTQHSFTVVDVTPESLSLRQIGQANNVIDQFDIRKPVVQLLDH